MRAEKVVKSLLDGAAGVTAIVGTKIYAVMAAQADDAPFIVYAKESATRDRYISLGGPTVVHATISIQCVALDYATLKNLGEEVRLALMGAHGTIAGVDVVSIETATEGADAFEPDLRLFGQNWQFEVIHQE